MDTHAQGNVPYIELAIRIAEMLQGKTGSVSAKTDEIIESAKKLRDFAT